MYSFSLCLANFVSLNCLSCSVHAQRTIFQSVSWTSGEKGFCAAFRCSPNTTAQVGIQIQAPVIGSQAVFISQLHIPHNTTILGMFVPKFGLSCSSVWDTLNIKTWTVKSSNHYKHIKLHLALHAQPDMSNHLKQNFC